MTRIIRAFTLLLLLGAPLRAQQPLTPQQGGITVTLVTFGLAQEVFERFGHNALLFHDAATGSDVAYQWGLFSFNEPNFLGRFLTGDNRYWMGPEDARALLERERLKGRPATLQRLNFTPQQAKALHDFVLWNEKPENAFYRYDYFQDNCSTRLRDALDHVVGGAIRRATDTVHTSLTYRRESVRLTDGDKPVQLGIDVALGQPADVPLTMWQSFFIPMRLRDALRDITIVGENGAQVPMVAEEHMVPLPPSTTPVEEKLIAPRVALRYTLLGALLALVIAVLTIALPTRAAAWGLALFGATWSLVVGMVGVILLFAWLATKHVFWVNNENVLLFTPLSLFLTVLIPSAVLSGRGVKAARALAGTVTLTSLVALVMSVLPGGQENHAIVALMLPVHFALYASLRAAMPRDKTPG